MFEINYLGHDFKVEDAITGDYICNICNCIIWFYTYDNEEFYLSLIDGYYMNAISCNETIIKNIIE